MPRQQNISAQTLKLLAALLEHSEEWHHGYDLSQRTGLKSGTLYPILMRLSEQGYLESEWLEPSKPGRPARHAYRLTPDGLALAKERAQTSSQFKLEPRTA
jgi:PadR family transcriptional regulator, regulatory protein PadR